MKKSSDRIKKIKKLIAAGLIFFVLLTGCTSGNDSDNTSGNGKTNTVNSQGTEELSGADKNKDNDFSTPENYNKKRAGVDYGYIKNDIKYYSTTIGEEKECGIIFPASYSTDKTYPVVYLIHGFGGSYNFLKHIFNQPVVMRPDEGNKPTFSENNTEKIKNMKIIIKIGSNSFTATLSDNLTAEAFKNSLPQNIIMEDVNGNEKYTVLPTNIRQEDPQNPEQINAGDIMCYGDKGLVLFYESFPTGYSYVRIGKIDNVSGLREALKGSRINATISLEE